MNTTKYFILIVIAFVLIMIFIVGFNPFAFGEAYFRPRSTPVPSVALESESIVLPADTQPTEVKIDR